MAGGTKADPVLPDILPVFPIEGAIVLPGSRIPLMVFEPRYIALLEDCLGQGRLFGLIQPDAQGDLAAVGTLVRVTAFAETGDGRFLITIEGMHRFGIVAEEQGAKGYRRMRVGYDAFAADRLSSSVQLGYDVAVLVKLVRSHLGDLEMTNADWETLSSLADDLLVDRLAMACPFCSKDRQALLEAPDHSARCSLMIALLQRDLPGAFGSHTLH